MPFARERQRRFSIACGSFAMIAGFHPGGPLDIDAA
jgi:hypothetical protein